MRLAKTPEAGGNAASTRRRGAILLWLHHGNVSASSRFDVTLPTNIKRRQQSSASLYTTSYTYLYCILILQFQPLKGTPSTLQYEVYCNLRPAPLRKSRRALCAECYHGSTTPLESPGAVVNMHYYCSTRFLERNRATLS